MKMFVIINYIMNGLLLVSVQLAAEKSLSSSFSFIFCQFSDGKC